MSNSIRSSYAIICEPTVKEMLSLPKMFDKAVDEDFVLYDKHTRQRIKNRYSLFHLLMAKYRPGRLLLLAMRKSECIGLLLASYTSDGVGVVHWVYVSPEHRKKGVAKNLLTEAEEKFKAHNCHKAVGTTELAQKFYQNVGYVQEAVLKNHWWGKDFFLYRKYI